ncbi:T-cell surface glycoprotein CD4-like [Hyperolius riggenbachi]|uniref:T-cell surface glycoprotein CD4-like n=1 Tax=Hyperolius riggenbachi TaxID=752182 RepID=UPI0035A32E7E
METWKLLGILYLQTGLCLVSSVRVIQEVGKKAVLPCGTDLSGTIVWKNDKGISVQSRVGGSTPYMQRKDHPQMKVLIDGSLEISDVELSHSGSYKCEKDKALVQEVELFILQVTAKPSSTLIVSEDLELHFQAAPQKSIRKVSWWKDGVKKTSEPVLEIKDVQTGDQGTYECQVEMDNGEKRVYSRIIDVKGFSTTPSVVYTEGKRFIDLPWSFNFKVRQTPLLNEVEAVSGGLYYSSQLIRNLTVDKGVACWSKTSTCESIKNQDATNLNIIVSSRQIGDHQMDIVLKIQDRQKKLQRKLCVANLTVSASQNQIFLESNVTLQCRTNCIEKTEKLCWDHQTIGQKICGLPGQAMFRKDVKAIQQTLGNWTCSVFTETSIIRDSTNFTLKLTLGFWDLSNPLLWVSVVVGVFVLLFVAVLITVLTARCRRVRRARYRTWLLENLNQHRMCECNGFAPKRLRENI